MALALAMERESGLQEGLQFQPGVFVNRVVGQTLNKKINDLEAGTQKAGTTKYLNSEAKSNSRHFFDQRAAAADGTQRRMLRPKHIFQIISRVSTSAGLPIVATDVQPGFVDTPMLQMPLRRFWVAHSGESRRGDLDAVEKRRHHIHITRRWALVAWYKNAFGRCTSGCKTGLGTVSASGFIPPRP